MGLAGGAADKAGNRYEDWWTALRVAELLRGRATRIRLEPPGPAGAGIEFELEADDGTWCEQVKDVPSKGPWTLNAAGKILEAVAGHLAGGKKVRLVLSTGAPELHDLSKRARGAETLAEFEGMITKAQIPQFVQVLENWSDNGMPVDREVGWRYLQAVHVEHIPPEALRRLVVSEYELLFVGDPEVIVRQLSGYLDEHLHQRLTGSQIRSHLLTVPGVRPRLLAGDIGTLTALAGTVDRFVRRVRRDKPAFGMAARPHVEQLYERLVAEDGPQVVVCEGSAGLGKSAVVTDVLVRLTEQGWPAAAVRMDGADASVQTAKDLGTKMTLPDSPAVLLAGVADEAPALLVIDQLDAVSTYNGRMSDAYEAVEDVLAQLVVAPNVKVLLVARTIDIDMTGGCPTWSPTAPGQSGSLSASWTWNRCGVCCPPAGRIPTAWGRSRWSCCGLRCTCRSSAVCRPPHGPLPTGPCRSCTRVTPMNGARRSSDRSPRWTGAVSRARCAPP
ncbi:hypothetical protein [Streptomyces lusitanus]|uniref:hypothetical protein n=1 Tax=Streptomyces lusitanus TaxID=68232 RepID=UPI0021BF9A4A|nr:hypothetical protein [Streptomyces lusitanus]